MSAVFQRADGEARQAEVEFVAMENSGGKESTSWENVENTWNVSIPHSKGRRHRRFWKMRSGKGKKEYKVSSKRNLPSERFWSKSEEMRMWDVAPKSCGKAFFRNEGQEFKEGCKEKRIHQNGPSRKYVKLVRKWRERKLDVWVLCRKS